MDIFFPTEFKIGDAYEYEYVSNTSSLTEQEVNDFKMQSSLNIKLGLSANDLELKFANNMSRTSNETSYMSRVASSSKIYHKFMRGCDYTTTTVDGITKNAEEDIKSKCADAFEENILDWPTPYSASKFVTATDLFSVDSKVHLNYRTAVAEGYFPCEEIPKNSSISFYSQHDEGDVPTLDIPVEQYFDRFSLMDDCFTVDDLLVNGEQRFKCCVLKRDCYLSDVALPKGLKMTLYNLPDRNSNWEERCELGSKPLVVTGKSDKRKVSVWAKDRADRMCAGRVELQTGYATQCYTYLD